MFNDLFTVNSDVHGYNTRQANKLHVPRAKSLAYSKSLKIRGCLYGMFGLKI